jgi:hypothetical protein
MYMVKNILKILHYGLNHRVKYCGRWPECTCTLVNRCTLQLRRFHQRSSATEREHAGPSSSWTSSALRLSTTEITADPRFGRLAAAAAPFCRTSPCSKDSTKRSARSPERIRLGLVAPGRGRAVDPTRRIPRSRVAKAATSGGPTGKGGASSLRHDLSHDGGLARRDPQLSRGTLLHCNERQAFKMVPAPQRLQTVQEHKRHVTIRPAAV